MPRLYRLMLPVPDLEVGVEFYRQLLGLDGERVSTDRHYFPCGPVTLALLAPTAEGRAFQPNREQTYIAVEDLDASVALVRHLDGVAITSEVEVRPWGERSAYLHDPFGNPLCLVQSGTEFSGGTFIA